MLSTFSSPCFGKKIRYNYTNTAVSLYRRDSECGEGGGGEGGAVRGIDDEQNQEEVGGILKPRPLPTPPPTPNRP